MKVYTARYFNARVAGSGLVPIGISVGLPRFGLRYELVASLFELAPTRDMLKLDKDEYAARYLARLEALGVDRARRLLEACFTGSTGNPPGRDAKTPLNGVVLLCFEDLRKPGEWCHRRMFAEWWQGKTGQATPELEEVESMGDLFAKGTAG